MLTFLKKFSQWNKDTFGTKNKNINFRNLLGQTFMEINIMRIAKEKMGIYSGSRCCKIAEWYSWMYFTLIE